MERSQTQASRRYLIGGLTLAGAWLVIPRGSDAAALAWPLINLSAVLAVAIALIRRPARRSLPWALLLLGLLLYSFGDVWFLTLPVLGHRALPFPSAADPLYLSSYLSFIAGLVLLLRTRSRSVDRAHLIDTTIISLGLGLFAWSIFMSPYAHDATLSLGARLVSLSYPALDVLLFAGVARLTVVGTRGNVALRLILAFAATQLVVDLLYAIQVLDNTFTAHSPVLGGYCLGWIALGAAALHPDADTIADEVAREAPLHTTRRIALLATAALMPPVLLLVLSASGDYDEIPAIAMGSALMFGLVLARVRGLLVSVEQHKHVAERLVEAEARYRGLLDNLPAVTYVDRFTDDDPAHATMIHIGPQVEELFGYTQQEWLSNGFDPWEELVHPDDHERVLQEGTAAAAAGGRFATEYRMRTKDGREVWIHDEATIEHQDDGSRLWHGVMFDVTERRRIEEALHEAEARYRILIETLPVAVYSQVADGDDSTFFVTPQAEDILGYPPEEWMRDAAFWTKILHPDDRDRVLALNAHVDATATPFSTEYRARHADGHYVWIADDARVVEGRAGGRLVWAGVLADISARKNAQEDLELSLTHLQRLSVERAMLLSRLVDAQEAERERIAEEIHDDPLQQLTAVSLRLSGLRRFLPAPDGIAALEALDATVRTAIGRLRTLMFELRPRTLDTGGLAEALREYLHMLHDQGGPEFRLTNNLSVEPGPETRTVAYRIAQEALHNVRTHAAAAEVVVVLETRDGGVHVVVQDDGSGADAKVVRDSPRGHMGITSMRERADMAGGWFRIDTTPGRGTRVEFWLPEARASIPSGVVGSRR
jgi:PAS domain S-box-containing protein